MINDDRKILFVDEHQGYGDKIERAWGSTFYEEGEDVMYNGYMTPKPRIGDIIAQRLVRDNNSADKISYVIYLVTKVKHFSNGPGGFFADTKFLTETKNNNKEEVYDYIKNMEDE